jgi:hypothetical protein
VGALQRAGQQIQMGIGINVMLNNTELDLLKKCILKNPRNTMYVSGRESNQIISENAEKMQYIYLSKLSDMLISPQKLFLDDYTNLRLYVTDELLSCDGWNHETNCPTPYGVEVEKLLNKLSRMAEIAEKNGW